MVVPLAVSAGGVLGALGRYGLSELFGDAFWPWSTWLTNVSGALLIGVLMALIAEVWSDQYLLRPFLGVGVLGGYTTLSTATLDVQDLVQHGRPGIGLLYLAGTLSAALVAVAAGSLVTSALLSRRGSREVVRR